MRKLLRRLTMACGLDRDVGGTSATRPVTPPEQRGRPSLWRYGAWALAIFVGLLSGGQTPAAEQLVLSGAEPNLTFAPTGQGSNGRLWQVYALGSGFRIFDNTYFTVPFTIKPTEPWTFGNADALVIEGDGRIGFGTFSPQQNLHVSTSDFFPTLRLESTDATYPRTWDLSGSALGFDLVDVTNGGTIPFAVQPGAPSATMFLASTGSVGMGTSSPNQIGAISTAGRYLNVRDNVGPARVVVQGAVQAELNLLHLNAPANQRNLRIISSGGTASFNVVNDAVNGFTVANAIAINMSNGNIGLKVANPTNPLELASGAKCTKGGVWTNASSRELKQDIQPLTIEQARETVRTLQPVGYRYKNEPEEHYCGFIAEDVPELVATNDRQSLAAMDIVSVLTRVVQDQDRQLDDARQRNARQQVTLDEQRTSLAQQQELLVSLNKRLTNLEQQSRDSGDQCRGTLVHHGR